MKGFIIRIGKERYWQFDARRPLCDATLPDDATWFETMTIAERQAALIRNRLLKADRQREADLVVVLPVADT